MRNYSPGVLGQHKCSRCGEHPAAWTVLDGPSTRAIKVKDYPYLCGACVVEDVLEHPEPKAPRDMVCKDCAAPLRWDKVQKAFVDAGGESVCEVGTAQAKDGVVVYHALVRSGFACANCGEHHDFSRARYEAEQAENDAAQQQLRATFVAGQQLLHAARHIVELGGMDEARLEAAEILYALACTFPQAFAYRKADAAHNEFRYKREIKYRMDVAKFLWCVKHPNGLVGRGKKYGGERVDTPKMVMPPEVRMVKALGFVQKVGSSK